VPLTKLKADAKDADTADKLAYLDRARPVYVHCDGGERAEEGAAIFSNLGFSDVRMLEGGVFEIARDSGLIIERE
jgi:rhodanese-related sulfurtransferase